MNDVPRQKLQEIIDRYGRSLCEDPRRCEALLRDICGEYKPEIFVLVNALKVGVATDMMASSHNLPGELLLARLTRRLIDDLAVTDEAAGWAVQSWALALRMTDRVSRRDSRAARPAAEREPPARRDPVQPQARQIPIWQKIGIEMVAIPAGEFLYGDDKEKMHLPEFYLARTPVTNAQYQAFVDATGHRIPDHWEDGEITAGKENHPVVRVSWEDALEFCEWAGCRLPTEQEWEKGARGTDGREYPWGDGWEPGRCNTMQASIQNTTPVGKYPGGASPYGLLGMADNVCEWCQEWYDEEHKYKVLRGCSWGIDHYWARSAYRFRDVPDFAHFISGFRCGVSSTSSL